MRLAAARMLVLALVGCSAPSAPVLPGASITPHLATRSVAPACGVDVTWYGSTAPDVRYRFTYDEHGRVAQARGTYARNAGAELAEYTWDNLDHMVHLVQTRDFDDACAEVVAHYNTLGDLVEYTWRVADGLERYLYTDFNGVNQPARLEITQQGAPTVWGYSFVYDASDRLTQAVGDEGQTTTWSYDDTAGTISSDTDNGAFTDVLTYDGDYRLLSVEWSGSDPSVIDGEQVYTWSGDQLDTVTYSSGSEQAPHQLQLVQTDTLRYDCTAARTHAGKLTRKLGARMRR